MQKLLFSCRFSTFDLINVITLR